MTSSLPEPHQQRPAHPRSAAATRTRLGHNRSSAQQTRGFHNRQTSPPLTALNDNSAPRTYGPPGVRMTQHAARGIVVYIGLDEAEAAADGTNLAALAQAVQDTINAVAPRAQSQAVIALAPEGTGHNLDAVRAVSTGSPAATGGSASLHGPVRSRVPSVRPPAHAEDAVQEQPSQSPHSYGRLHIDIPRRDVTSDGKSLQLTSREFDLLTILTIHAGETLSRETLIDAVWGDSDEKPDTRTVDVHIRRLRNRLAEFRSIVRTIRGAGYRYDEHPDVTVWQAIAR